MQLKALGIAYLVFYTFPEQDTLESTMANVRLSHDILGFVTNFLVTAIICYQLVSSHRRLAKSLPAKRLAVYRAAVRILIESGLPLAVAGTVNAVLFTIPFSYDSITEYGGDANALVSATLTVQLVYFALQVRGLLSTTTICYPMLTC